MILDFSGYITEKAMLFTGREWVFRAIDRWLADPDGSRYFLLTGEPGSGKTALAARLAQFSKGSAGPATRSRKLAPAFLHAAHFCRAGAPSWVDPRTFAQSISLQLAAIPEFARALVDVGDRDVNIDVQQRVVTAESGTTITAVHIENLVISGLSAQEAFNRTVLDPLRSIYDQGYRQQIIVLVDSLDEALTHAADTTIVDLLAGLQDVAPRLRFIVTSRPEPRVENRFRAADQLLLSDPEHKSANDEDVRTYVTLRIEHDKQLPQGSSAVDDITEKADGNFQYVAFLLKALSEHQLTLDEVAGLPPGLDGLYFDSLDRVVKLGKKDWATTYKPVLGALSVAQEPLTLHQLRIFSQLAFDPWDAVGDLLQFIEAVPGSEAAEADDVQDNEDRYRLYHQSVVDFLRRRQLTNRDNGKKKALHNLYFLAADDWHKRIVASYENQTGERIQMDWTQDGDVVRYGLRRLTAHLYQSRHLGGHLGKLQALLQDDVYVDRRLLVLPNPNLVLDDLRTVLDLTVHNGDLPKTWTHIMKYRRVLRNERDFERIKQAAAGRRYALALERTALYSHLPNSQALARLWIAWTAAADGRGDDALAIARHALARPPSGGTTHATSPALQRVLIRTARAAAQGYEQQCDWLRRTGHVWPEQEMERLLAEFSEQPDSWGAVLDAAGTDIPMAQLIKELTTRSRQLDAPFGGIREAAFFYRQRLAAGLFNSRDEGQAWLDNVRRTVDLVALDDYPSYREMALLWASVAILAQPDEDAARAALALVLGGIFRPEPGFWGDTIAAAADGLARESDQACDPEYLHALLEQVEATGERGVDPTIPRKLELVVEWRGKVGLPVDPWSFRMRRRGAVAAVLHRRGDTAGAEERLRQAGAEHYQGSYAGFRTLARLSLACRWLEWRRSREAVGQVEAARADAGHMLDEVLKEERLDLVSKMRDWATDAGENSFVLAEHEGLTRLLPKRGMERRLYIEFLSAVWHDDDARLKRLLPLALDDATTADAVLGRLLTLEAAVKRADRPFLALLRTMDLSTAPEA